MRKQLGQIIDEQVRRVLREEVAAKSISHAADPGAGIARCLDIDFGIAYDHHLLGGRAEFTQDLFDAHRVGLLALEAVAAIHMAKMAGHAQLLDDAAADAHGLIGVNGHRHAF